MKYLSASVLITVACSCASAPANYESNHPHAGATRPQWIDGKPSSYPEKNFLTAVGRGNQRQSCEHDARAALAKIFYAHVQQISNDWQGHVSMINETGRVRVEAMSVEQLTRVSTDYVLRGVRIAEVWQGPDTFHCLAVLDRFAAQRTTITEIDRLDVEIAEYIKRGDRSDNPTQKYFSYKRAVALLQQRQALNAELRILNPAGLGKKAVTSWKQLLAKFGASKESVNIGLRIEGSDAETFQHCLVEQLREQRISIVEYSSDVDLMIQGRLMWQWAGRIRSTFMVKININLRANDVNSGTTVFTMTDRLKTGRPQRSMALATASTKLCMQVAPRLADRLRRQMSGG